MAFLCNLFLFFNFSLDVSTELPSVKDMQLCLLNEGEEVLLPLCQSLLFQALEDPGYDGPYVCIGYDTSIAC